MSNTHSLAMIGLFTIVMGWAAIVAEHGQKATDLRNQENIVRMK